MRFSDHDAATAWNRLFTTHFKMTRGQNLSGISNCLQAGGTQAANPTGFNSASILSRPSIMLKPDDIQRALESQLPP